MRLTPTAPAASLPTSTPTTSAPTLEDFANLDLSPSEIAELLADIASGTTFETGDADYRKVHVPVGTNLVGKKQAWEEVEVVRGRSGMEGLEDLEEGDAQALLRELEEEERSRGPVRGDENLGEEEKVKDCDASVKEVLVEKPAPVGESVVVDPVPVDAEPAVRTTATEDDVQQVESSVEHVEPAPVIEEVVESKEEGKVVDAAVVTPLSITAETEHVSPTKIETVDPPVVVDDVVESKEELKVVEGTETVTAPIMAETMYEVPFTVVEHVETPAVVDEVVPAKEEAKVVEGTDAVATPIVEEAREEISPTAAITSAHIASTAPIEFKAVDHDVPVPAPTTPSSTSPLLSSPTPPTIESLAESTTIEGTGGASLSAPLAEVDQLVLTPTQLSSLEAAPLSSSIEVLPITAFEAGIVAASKVPTKEVEEEKVVLAKSPTGQEALLELRKTLNNDQGDTGDGSSTVPSFGVVPAMLEDGV